ncbi:MAG: DEAD/DEAH box helicase, partial [Desulfovibrio sp.]|nr:DEAD/DEAH box helicase [Desulfovibrio sp.]
MESGELFHPLGLTGEEAYAFLKDVRSIEEAGILCRVPNWWKRGSAQISMQVKLGDKKPSLLGFDSLVSMQPELVANGTALTAAEIRRLLAQTEGLAFLKGKWVVVDHARLEALLRQMEEYDGSLSLMEALRLETGIGEKEDLDIGPMITNGKWLGDLFQKLRQPKGLKSQRVPSTVNAQLRPYQKTGYNWLLYMQEIGFGACLADDMGLGKTVQTIAVMLNQAPKGPCLVVAPTTVCANWEREIARFAPRLETKRLGLAARNEAVKAMGRGEVLVVGYGLLPNVAEELASRSWAMAVYDEAQALKNPLTKRAAAARNVKADFRVALTGTPIENRLDDLWSIFSIINPGLLGSYERFRRRFGQAAPGSPQGKALRQLTRPFLLRRLKSAVLDELPARTEQNIIIDPSDDEKAFYEILRRKAVESIEQAAPMHRRFLILAWLTKMRLACCSPSLSSEDVKAGARRRGLKFSSKIDRLRETLEELMAGGHKALVFSQFTSFLALVRQALEKAGIAFLYLDGQTPEKERRRLVDAFQNGA